MSGTTPHRRHSPAVYRRRRVTLLVVILAIGVGIWLLIAQPWRGFAFEAGASPTPSQQQEGASSLPIPDTQSTPGAADDAAAETESDAGTDGAEGATPSATPVAEACIARDIAVEALADQPTYASGQNPQLSIRLTNNGTTDCTLNVGTSTQVFTITSGSDTWWRSTDCQSEPSDMVVLLTAGQSVTSAAPLTWDRTRSSVDTCAAADRPRAPGGGASYHLTVEIGGIASSESVQLLLY